MTQPIRLGDLLVRAGVISEATLRRALAEQQQSGDKLGVLLVRMGLLSEDLLVKALSRQLRIPIAELGDVAVPTQVLQKLGASFCEVNAVLPLKCTDDRRHLRVAVSDPCNVVLMDDLARLSGMRIDAQIAAESQIVARVRSVFGNAMSPAAAVIEKRPATQKPAQQSPSHRIVTAVDDRQVDSSGQIEQLLRLTQRQNALLRSMFDLLVSKGVLEQDDMKKLM